MRDMTTDSTHLLVKEEVQTFIDNVVIESVQNATRRWHSPQRRDGGSLVHRDRPWERITYFTYSTYTVIRDPDDGKFKCWYQDLDQSLEFSKLPRPILHPGAARMAYAESEDGVTWTKPELDHLEIDGRRTNIVHGGDEYGHVLCMNVVLDPRPDAGDQKFRAVYTRLWKDEATSPGPHNWDTRRIEVAHSADGIHWQVYDQLPTFGLAGSQLGDVSIMYFDENSQEFVHNTRHHVQGAGPGVNMYTPRNSSFIPVYEPNNFAAYNKRRIFQCRSHDFVNWSEPIVVAAADDVEDNLDESFYGMCQFKVGTVYLATVGVFRYVENEMEAQLLISRDGTRWSRTNKRQPFLAPRGEGHWDAHMVSMVSPPIDMGDELWFYHGGTNYHHDWWIFGVVDGIDHPEVRDPHGGSWGLGLATLRKEGFAGLYASEHREGIVVTRPLMTLGTRIEINAKCNPGGSVRVEVADNRDEIVGACSADRSDPFSGDSVRHTATWGGDPAIPAGDEERTNFRKVRFYIRDAELFSFRFTDSATPASTGRIG